MQNAEGRRKGKVVGRRGSAGINDSRISNYVKMGRRTSAVLKAIQTRVSKCDETRAGWVRWGKWRGRGCYVVDVNLLDK